MIILPDTHIALSSTDEITQICEPLFSMSEITYFGFFREYRDNSYITLGTNADWFSYIHKESFFFAITEFNPPDPDHQPALEIHPWKRVNDLASIPAIQQEYEKKMELARNQFNITDGICLLEKHNHHHDYFNFASHKDNSRVFDFYFNHLDVLKRFVVYFREKAAHLIQQAQLNKFLLKERSCLISQQHSQIYAKTLQNKVNFLKQTQLPHVRLSGHYSHCSLTNQQLNCLYLLLKGETAKSASRKLNISSRTFESHIHAIKTQCNLSSKSALIQLGRQPEIQQYFLLADAVLPH